MGQAGKRDNMGQFVIPFCVLLGSYLFQDGIILPLEMLFRHDGYEHLVSLMFIPHGVKVALVLIFGLRAFPAIFTAQLTNGLILQNILNFDSYVILGALAGTLCFCFRFWHIIYFSASRFIPAPFFKRQGQGIVYRCFYHLPLRHLC